MPGRGYGEPQGRTTTVAGASIIDWSPSRATIEVSEANPGLCAVLENAALLYAGGQAAPARTLLEEGVQHDPETLQSPLAWLALFDLLQRANDRPAFEQLSMQYVIQFESSAPAWEAPAAAPAAVAPAASGGFVAVAGRLSATSVTQLNGLKRVIDKRVPNARLDLSSVISFDDGGARQLADTLAQARRNQLPLSIERPEKLRMALEAAVKRGREGGAGAWLLLLELLQWQREQGQFDERALEYAIAFEESPPSWEPPPLQASAPDATAAAASADGAETDGDRVLCTGALVGPGSPYFQRLADLAHNRDVVALDLARVERVDFVCAGALLNAINRIEAQRKTVQVHGATPIIRALLLLIGVAPRHFVKKAG